MPGSERIVVRNRRIQQLASELGVSCRNNESNRKENGHTGQRSTGGISDHTRSNPVGFQHRSGESCLRLGAELSKNDEISTHSMASRSVALFLHFGFRRCWSTIVFR
jgi:hypothetical protein